MQTLLRYPTTLLFTSGCRVATGRSAILHLIERYRATLGLMPCYVPDGVIHPFQHANVKCVFYKLKADLSPDEDDLQRLIYEHAGARIIVVAIHYFGWLQSLKRIAAMTRAGGGILFEDCAHRLLGGSTEGDVVLYSLNKFLPVTDGAIMVSRNPAVDVSIDRGLMPLPEKARFAYSAHLEANGRIARGDSIGQAFEDSRNAYDAYYEEIGDMKLHSQSAESRALEAETDFSEMRWTREVVSAKLSYRLAGLAVRPRLSTQFAFPVRCHGRRREMEMALYSAGVLASTLTNKWDHVLPEFKIEHDFFDDHLLLPLTGDIDVMVDALKAF